MPEMSNDDFKLLDWRTMDEDAYTNYIDGRPDAQMRTLSQAQITNAKKAHEWTTGDIARIDGIGADDIFGNLAVPKWGRMWWFMYFWKEVKSGGKNRSDSASLGYGRGNSINDNLAYIFSQLFVRPAPGLPAALVPRIPFDDHPDSVMQSFLYILLEIGFKKIQLGVEDGKVNDSAFEWKNYCLLREKKSLEIAWRSEDRTALQIMEKGGFEPQTHDQSWATFTNMRANWHPFSKDTVKNYLWYRLGQNDNCKYTVTSLAKEVRVALGFPKLDTDNYAMLPMSNPDTMSPPERLLAKKDNDFLIGEVSLEGGGRTETRFLVVTKVTVAQVILEQYVFDTQQAQEAFQFGNGFREMGVGKVPMRNIVGLFSFFRVHHGIAEPEGFTAVINRPGCTPIKSDHLLRFTASEQEAKQLASILEPIYNQTLLMGPVTTAWGPTGYSEPTKKLTLADGTQVNRIRQIKLNNLLVYSA